MKLKSAVGRTVPLNYSTGYIHMDISILYMGSQGSLGWDTLGGIPWVGYLGGTDGTLGPMGPWDRWDLGLKDPRYFLRGYFLRVVYRYPARPGRPDEHIYYPKRRRAASPPPRLALELGAKMEPTWFVFTHEDTM